MKRMNIIAVALGMLAGACILTGCYDDSDLKERIDNVEDRVRTLEEKLDGINTDIMTLQRLVSSLSGGAVITAVERIPDGYRLTLSDGRVLEVHDCRKGTDGKDGADGKDAPVIGVSEYEGIYYWTITVDGKTDWLTDADGNKLPVTGAKGDKGDPGTSGQPGSDGNDGADGKTPVIGVKDGYWTVDYGDGPRFVLDEKGEKVRAVPENAADGIFKSIVPTDEGILFTLISGETFIVPRVDDFGVAIDTSDPYIRPGQRRVYPLTLTGVSDIYVTKKTDGWSASVENDSLIVSAPASASTGEKADVRIIVVNKRHDVRAFKISLEVADIRVLTFEDEDYKGDGNMLGQKNWSSLIDSPQYGGPLLYPNSTARIYNWYDQSNTELASQFVNQWGDGNFWGGGIVISNYVDETITSGDYMHQLSVYWSAPNGNGGNGGSRNFAVQNGYKDLKPGQSAYNNILPRLFFKDGKARIIKSMMVNVTTYFVNCWVNGNGLTDPAGPDSYFKIVTHAYGPDGKELDAHPEFVLARGDQVIEKWEKFDLSSLGPVTAISFNLVCPVDNGSGMSQPAYFAIDDITVVF